MQRPNFKYIGRTINLKSLRDCILDNSLGEGDTILLNYYDFDTLILEYRDIYKVSMEVPYYLLSVLIQEDSTGKVPVNRVGILNA